MTAATSYTTLDSDDLGANKILRAATMSALDQNPVSIAQRGTGAPWLNGVGAIATLTSGSGNWTVPAGVYRIKATCVGGSGTASTFATLSASTTSVTGGDINIAGGKGTGTSINTGGGSTHGHGGYRYYESDTWHNVDATGYGAGGAEGGGKNGAGTAIKVFSVEPGDSISYAVGSGTDGGTGGIIIIEY